MGLGGQRHIWVIRHGKSADGAPGMSDHDRPLNQRGQHNGATMCSWYAAQPHPAQWIWCSSAVRAQQTAAFVARGFNAPVVNEPDLYLAPAERLLDCLQRTPQDIGCVAVVAHNPGLTHLVNLLCGDAVTDNLVTFGSAFFRTHSDWADLRFGGAELISLHTPKTI